MYNFELGTVLRFASGLLSFAYVDHRLHTLSYYNLPTLTSIMASPVLPLRLTKMKLAA